MMLIIDLVIKVARFRNESYSFGPSLLSIRSFQNKIGIEPLKLSLFGVLSSTPIDISVHRIIILLPKLFKIDNSLLSLPKRRIKTVILIDYRVELNVAFGI